VPARLRGLPRAYAAAPAQRRLAIATSMLTCLTLAAVSPTLASGTIAEGDQVAFATAEDRADRASRSLDRGITGAGLAGAPAAPEVPPVPVPVADLNQTQMNNAKAIVDAGAAMGLPKRAYVIAVATSLQESQLYNLASTRIPESYNYNAEGSGSDHDSVGLFQQRPSSGWGRVPDLMNPTYAAQAFYTALVRVPGWENMALTAAAQRVQVSAYPNHYAKHEARAQAIVDALVP
jgi:hypothetical protein